MARVNVEERFWTDPRLEKLSIKLHSRYKAIGQCVELWHIGQEFYSNKNKFTMRAFKYHGLSKYLIECGFAVLENDEIKIRGADDQFKWILCAKEGASKGGKASKKESGQSWADVGPMLGGNELPNKINEVTQPSSSYSSSSNIVNKKVGYTSPKNDILFLNQENISRALERIAKKAGL